MVTNKDILKQIEDNTLACPKCFAKINFELYAEEEISVCEPHCQNLYLNMESWTPLSNYKPPIYLNFIDNQNHKYKLHYNCNYNQTVIYTNGLRDMIIDYWIDFTMPEDKLILTVQNCLLLK